MSMERCEFKGGKARKVRLSNIEQPHILCRAAQALIPVLGEMGDELGHIVSSRPAQAKWQDPVSKDTTNKPTNTRRVSGPVIYRVVIIEQII